MTEPRKPKFWETDAFFIALATFTILFVTNLGGVGGLYEGLINSFEKTHLTPHPLVRNPLLLFFIQNMFLLFALIPSAILSVGLSAFVGITRFVVLATEPDMREGFGIIILVFLSFIQLIAWFVIRLWYHQRRKRVALGLLVALFLFSASVQAGMFMKEIQSENIFSDAKRGKIDLATALEQCASIGIEDYHASQGGRIDKSCNFLLYAKDIPPEDKKEIGTEFFRRHSGIEDRHLSKFATLYSGYLRNKVSVAIGTLFLCFGALLVSKEIKLNLRKKE